jgi:hypothetical protein
VIRHEAVRKKVKHVRLRSAQDLRGYKIDV